MIYCFSSSWSWTEDTPPQSWTLALQMLNLCFPSFVYDTCIWLVWQTKSCLRIAISLEKHSSFEDSDTLTHHKLQTHSCNWILAFVEDRNICQSLLNLFSLIVDILTELRIMWIIFLLVFSIRVFIIDSFIIRIRISILTLLWIRTEISMTMWFD